MRGTDKLLAAGNAAQLEKLRQNTHKQGFGNMDKFTFDYLYYRLVQEENELDIELNGTMKKDVSYADIRKEAADVANFAHMIILKCDVELKK